MNVQCPHKWWSTIECVVFGSSSALPPLVSEGGGLACESVGKADLLSDHFDSEQSRETVDLPLTFALQQPVGCLVTTYKSYDDSNIGGKEQVRDIGIQMNNAANLTFYITNLV